MELDLEQNKTSVGISEEDLKNEVKILEIKGKNQEEVKFNLFPSEYFPYSMRNIITETNEVLNFPVDFIGASMLYAASVAIGNTYRIKVKEGWTESGVIYLSLVAPPGTNKSHPLSFALQPITDKDQQTFGKYEKELKIYDLVSGMSKGEREANGYDEPVKPIWEKSLLSDFTSEALLEVHHFNQRGIGVYADELAGWFKNFNRYNSGSDTEFWLSAWSTKPISVDRKSGTSIFITQPYISVAGTMQNGVLNELAKGSRIINGFMDRILFVMPDNVKKECWSEKQLDASVITQWNSIISRLHDLHLEQDESGNPVPQVLELSKNAKQELFNWQKANTDRANDAENDQLRGIYSKMEVYAIRFALLFQMLAYACGDSDNQVVGVQAVKRALALVEYFTRTAEKVNAIISNIDPLEKYSQEKQMLYEVLPEYFKTVEGVLVAEENGIHQRVFKRFLNDKDLFRRVRRGEYEKIL